MVREPYGRVRLARFTRKDRALTALRAFRKRPKTTVLQSTCWQKFAVLKPKNIRTCLAKQDRAGSYMWVTVKL